MLAWHSTYGGLLPFKVLHAVRVEIWMPVALLLLFVQYFSKFEDNELLYAYMGAFLWQACMVLFHNTTVR